MKAILKTLIIGLTVVSLLAMMGSCATQKSYGQRTKCGSKAAKMKMARYNGIQYR